MVKKLESILKRDGDHSQVQLARSSISGQKVEPSTQQPSADRLSVTFAIAEGSTNTVERGSPPRKELPFSDIGHCEPVVNPASMQRIGVADDEEDTDENNYSASACAIMQRRSSTRRSNRRKRRPSSPFGWDADSAARRRSSAYTISSGETAVSTEETGNQEQVFEKLKLHKEVLGGVKQQAWPLRRKIKLVRQAKSYVRKHEGALQERLAQTRSTRDAIARISLFTTKKWQYFRRELVNLQTWLIPWELRIKEIESHFGSAVASYFTFLRWLFWINLVMSATLTAFVAIPEMLIADAALAGERKIMLREEKIKSKHLLTLWQFEGVLKYSPFFYGWYTNQDSESGYRLPLAYFVTNLVVYTYSFVAILRKMAQNSRLSKLTEKEDECAFSWKLFTGWDFMIGNPETAHNRMASIVLGFKEALLEEAEKEKDERNWKIISMRIFVNVSVMSLLALSAFAVVKVVGRSAKEFEQNSWWRQNEITIVMSLITYLFPILFEILGFLENYHPRKQLRMQLARIMVLNLLNLYSLIFALFGKINSMKQDLGVLKPINKSCTYRPIQCNDSITKSHQLATLASLGLILLSNVTHTQTKRDISEIKLPPGPESFYLNPYIDNETLEEIYNVGDYPPLDYSYYGDYEDSGINVTTTEESTLYNSENNTTFSDNFSLTNIFSTTIKPTLISASMHTGSQYVSMSTNEIDIEENNNNNNNGISETSTSFITSTESSPTKSNIVEKVSTYKIPILRATSGYSTTDASTSQQTNEFSIGIESTVETNDPRIPLPEENYIIKCFEQACTSKTPEDSAAWLKEMDPETWKKLRRLCWETMFGQELAKLTVMDLILTIVSTLAMDFFRAVFVRFMNNCWCWDLEKQFPQYGDFKIAENILHLVNNQGMVWMGMFFSPGLTALNLLKLGILMYLRSWAVLTCNVPHEVIFRASRSNNFYFALLLTMLFLCVLPVGYAIVWVEPSWHCGPFSGYQKIYHLATKRFMDSLPEPIQRCIDYIASPGIVIPLIVLMTLIIYYMASLASSLREANNDLKIQLRHERTEERRKLFKIVEKRQEIGDTAFARWKKILPVLPPHIPTKTTVPKGLEVAIAIETPDEAKEDIRVQAPISAIGMLNDEEDAVARSHSLFQQVYEKRRKNSWISNKRLPSVHTDSIELQLSESGVIPEIRINEGENKTTNIQANESVEDVVILQTETNDSK